MDKCEMYDAQAALNYEKVDENVVVVCPLSPGQCPYNQLEQKKFFSVEEGAHLRRCTGNGLVKQSGLIDITLPQFKSKMPKSNIHENGIIITP